MLRFAAVMSAAALLLLASPYGGANLVGLLMLHTILLLSDQRVTPFELVIPVDAHRILLTRVGTALALVWLPLIAWIVGGHLRAASDNAGASWLSVPEQYRSLALPVMALFVILPHARWPGVISPPDRSPHAVLLRLAAIIAGCALVIWRLPIHVAMTLLTCSAVALFAATWSRMPRSYQLAPLQLSSSDRARSVRSGTRSDPSWWRAAFTTAIPLSVLGDVAFFGLAGVSDMWLMYLFALFRPHSTSEAYARLQWVNPLPVSRNLIAAAVLAPIVLSLLAVGLSAGVILPLMEPEFSRLDVARPHEYTRDDIFDDHTMVPLAFWQIAPGRKPPVVRAPWGEATMTDTMHLPGVTLYNPYSARIGSSKALIEWQFERASAAVHGRPYTMAAYYSEDNPSPPRVTRNVRTFVLGGSLALTLLILLAWLLEIPRWYRLAARPALAHLSVTIAGLLAIVVAAFDIFGMFKHGAPLLVPLATAIVFRVARALPNMPVVLLVAALPVVLSFLLFRWQMGQSDVASRVQP